MSSNSPVLLFYQIRTIQIFPLFISHPLTKRNVLRNESALFFFQLIQKIAMTDNKFYKYLAMKGKHIT